MRVIEKVPYAKGSTSVDTTGLRPLSWVVVFVRIMRIVFIACCRHMGIPARYVSGYVILRKMAA